MSVPFDYRSAILEARLARRALGRSRVWALLTTAVLAAAISVLVQAGLAVDDFWWKPHRVASLRELQVVRGGYSKYPSQLGLLSAAEYQQLRVATDHAMVAVWPVQRVGRLLEGSYSEVLAAEVEPAAFTFLAIRPVLGSAPTAGGDAAVVGGLISHRLWHELGADSELIGSALPLAGTRRRVRVEGVLPADFRFPAEPLQPDVLLPRELRLTDASTARQLKVLVRVPRAEAFIVQEAMSLIAAARAATAPPSRSAYGSYDRVVLTPAIEIADPGFRQMLLLLAGTALLLSTLMVVSVAGMCVARVVIAKREFQVRAALGGTLARCAIGPCVEAGLLVGAACIAAAFLIEPIRDHLLRSLPPGSPLRLGDALGARLPIALAVASCLVMAALTALIVTAVAVIRDRKALSRTERVIHFDRVLLGGQLGIAIVVTAIAAVARTTVSSLWHDISVDYKNLTAVGLEIAPTERRAMVSRVEQTITRGAGGTEMAVTDAALFRGFYRADLSWRPPQGAMVSCLGGPKIGMSSDLLSFLRIPLLQGRSPTAEELVSASPVLVLSKSAALACWPGESAVGKSIVLADRMFQVVGVVADAKLTALQEDGTTAEVYFPLDSVPPGTGVTILVRSAMDPAQQVSLLSSRLRDAGLAPYVTDVTSIRRAFEDTGWRPLAVRSLLTIWGGCALAIGAVAVLAALALQVSRRRRELVTRIVLGARSRTLVGAVLLPLVRPALAAVVIAVPTVVTLLLRLAQLLPEVRSSYLIGMSQAALLYAGIAALACVWCVRRIAGLDPAEVLREI